MSQHVVATKLVRRFSLSIIPTFLLLTVFSLIALSPLYAWSAEATFSWRANTEPTLAGYKIYIGNSSRAYTNSVTVGNKTTHTLTNLAEGRTYYFAATAYDTNGNESGYSNEVSWISPSSGSSPVPVDTDGDGISDSDEINIYGTDPTDPDTDNDGFTDGYEIANGFDPVYSNSSSQQTEIIIDTGEAGTASSGTWGNSSGADPYGSNSLYSSVAGATYTFETSANGSIQIALWWTEWATRSTAVPVEIYDGNTLIDIIEVNQQVNGGKWNVLGTYEFSETPRVIIISEGDDSTCADAVKFTSSTADEIIIDQGSTTNSATEIIIDNRDAETSQTGTWKVSGATDPYGADSVYSRDGATFTWHLTPSQSGIYEVSMRWTAWASRSLNVPVDIEHSDGVATVYVDQQENGGQWNVQGQYYFESGTTYDITITSQLYPSSTCADAIKVQMKMD